MRAFTFIWFAWIALLSVLPGWRRIFHTRGRLHMPGHALIFAFSAFLVCRSAQSFSRRLAGSAAVFTLGCVLEGAEFRIFGGRFEWEDVATDAFGVLAFLLISILADRVRSVRPVEGDS